MAKKPIDLKGSSDLCTALSWSIFPIREYIKRKPPTDSETARSCKDSITNIYDLMDQIGCPYVESFKKSTLELCKVKGDK